MVRLSIGGQYLVLPPDLRGTLILKSPLLYRQQEGSLSLPFTISALEPANREILGYPDVLASVSRVLEKEAVLEIGPARFEGILRATRISSKRIECSLAIPPGNIPASIWDRKLTSFDLGTVVYPTQKLPTKFYAAHNLENLFDTSPGRQMQVSLKKDGIYIASAFYNHIKPDYENYNAPTDPFWADFANEINAKNLAGITAYGDKTSFSIYTESTSKFTIRVDKANVLEGDEIWEKPLTNRVMESFEFYQTSTPGVFPLYQDKRYCLPVIKDSAWYSKDQNPDWKGYVNNAVNGGLLFNSSEPGNFNSNSLAPAIYLKWLITTLCEKVGYRFLDDFFTGDLEKLIIWTNQSIDRATPDVPIPKLNVFQKEWKLAGQLPEWTLEQLSDELFNLFATRLYFNSNTRIARMVRMQDVLSQVLTEDYNDRIFLDIDIEQVEKKPQQLSFQLDSSDDLSKEPDLDTPGYATLFTKYPLAIEEGVEFDPIQTKFSPMVQNTLVATDVNLRRTSKIEQPGISTLYSQEKKKKENARVAFVATNIADTDITNPGSFELKFTADNQTQNYALEWNAYKGLHNKFWSRYFYFLENTFSVKIPTDLSVNDLASWGWYEIKHFRGLNFLPAQIDINFTIHGISSVSTVTWQKT